MKDLNDYRAAIKSNAINQIIEVLDDVRLSDAEKVDIIRRILRAIGCSVREPAS